MNVLLVCQLTQAHLDSKSVDCVDGVCPRSACRHDYGSHTSDGGGEIDRLTVRFEKIVTARINEVKIEVTQKQDEQQAFLKDSLFPRSSDISQSDANRWSRIQKKLIANNADVKFTPVVGKRAVFTTENKIADIVRDISDEALFDVKMYPILRELLTDDDRLLGVFNSEKDTFLENPIGDGGDRKPDFNVSPTYSVRYRVFKPVEEKKRTSLHDERDKAVAELKSTQGMDIPYAGPAKQFFGDVRVLESKLHVGEQGKVLYQLVGYLQWLSSHSDRRARGMIFDKTTAHLMEVQGSEVLSRTTVEWVDGGSFGFIRDFLLHDDSSTHKAIVRAMADQKITFVADPAKDLSTSFLGAGLEGYVFRVKTSEGCECAMKVVPQQFIAQLEHQYEVLTKENLNLPAIFPVPASLLVNDMGGSLLFKKIGVPSHLYLASCTRENGKTIVDKAHSALQKIHEQMSHGDPRLDNFVVVEEDDETNVYWVDFSRASMNTKACINEDLRIFRESAARRA
jgi:hypothetical protein